MAMKDHLEPIVEIVKSEFPEILGVYLFGSQVTGELHRDSDIDLALLFDPGYVPDALDMYHLQGKVSGVTGFVVDLGILSLDNVVFAKEVIATGRRVYCRDEKQCDEFSMYCFSYYAQLNLERAEILASYDADEK